MAHIRSILPQRGGAAPVDNNTTALFHYDTNANDSLKGIRPFGNKYSLLFNGTSSYVDCGTSANYSSAIMTIRASIKVNAWSSDANTGGVIASSYTSAMGFIFYVSNTQKLGFRHHNGTTSTDLQSSTTLSLNTWYDVAGTYDGTTLTVYINGVASGSIAMSGTAVGQNLLTIGKASWGNSSYFNGCINNVQLYNVALSISDIQNTANTSASISPVGYWKLDDNQGTVARSYTTLDNDGVISGCTWTDGNTIYNLSGSGYLGSTGSGLLIEEGTTNLLVNPCFATNISSWGNGSWVTMEWVNRYNPITNANGAMHLLDSDATTGFCTQDIHGLANGTTITATAYIEIVTGSINNVEIGGTVFYKNPAGSGPDVYDDYTWQGKGKPIVESYSGNIYKLTHVITFDSSKTLDYYEMRISHIDAGNCELYVYATQVENKAFGTSFVNGSRQNHYLTYPSTLINPSGGTFSFWINVKDLTSANPILSNGSTESNQAFDLLIGNDTANGKFYYRRYWGSGANNAQVGYAMPTSVVNTWTFIAGTWGNGQPLKLYVNGSLVATSYNADFSAYSGNLGIGCTFRNNPHCFIDELRFDSIIRTDTEISSWYYQGMNGW